MRSYLTWLPFQQTWTLSSLSITRCLSLSLSLSLLLSLSLFLFLSLFLLLLLLLSISLSLSLSLSLSRSLLYMSLPFCQKQRKKKAKTILSMNETLESKRRWQTDGDISDGRKNKHFGGLALTNPIKWNQGLTQIFIINHREGRFVRSMLNCEQIFILKLIRGQLSPLPHREPHTYNKHEVCSIAAACHYWGNNNRRKIALCIVESTMDNHRCSNEYKPLQSIHLGR